MSEEQQDKAWVPTFTRKQRDALRLIGEEIIALAADKDVSKTQVVDALEIACMAVTKMRLRDFRTAIRCPDCLQVFTSAATKRVHYDPANVFRCRHPATVPELTLKSRGRWGWSDEAIAQFEERQGGPRRG